MKGKEEAGESKALQEGKLAGSALARGIPALHCAGLEQERGRGEGERRQMRRTAGGGERRGRQRPSRKGVRKEGEGRAADRPREWGS